MPHSWATPGESQAPLPPTHRAWVARTRPDSSPAPLSQVCLFLKRGADQHALDQEQQDPLSIAIQEANADIVTL